MEDIMSQFKSTNYSKNVIPITEVHSLYFTMEETFSPEVHNYYLQKYWLLSFPIVIVYVILIHLGVRFMKNRPKFSLRGPLFFWNASLALFYIIMAYRIFPEVIHLLYNGDFYQLVCLQCPVGCTRVAFFWGWYFVMMKLPELLDTVFVVLRKQPLFFLHWYHHCTVFVFSVYVLTSQSAPGSIFAIVNGVVHALMYSYYAIKSLNIHVPRFVSMSLTLVQLSQMAVGVLTILYAYVMKKQGIHCSISEVGIFFALGIYVSYLFLFSWYFYQAYIVKDALIIAKFKGEKIE